MGSGLGIALAQYILLGLFVTSFHVRYTASDMQLPQKPQAAGQQ